MPVFKRSGAPVKRVDHQAVSSIGQLSHDEIDRRLLGLNETVKTALPAIPGAVSTIAGVVQQDPRSGKARFIFSYYPPNGRVLTGVHLYVEVSDYSSGPSFNADTADVATAIVPGRRIDLGVVSRTSADTGGYVHGDVDTGIDLPESTQPWRFYLGSVGKNYDPAPVAANEPNPTPSIVIQVQPSSIYPVGYEYAPLVMDVDVTLETEFQQSAWMYRATITWKDPTDPGRSGQFKGVNVLSLFFSGVGAISPYDVSTAGLAPNGLPIQLPSVDPVGVGFQSFTTPWRQIPVVAETHSGYVLSTGEKGTNSIVYKISPYWSFVTPDLITVRQQGGTGTPGNGTPGTGRTVTAAAMADFTNLTVDAEYGYYRKSGQEQLLIIPRFKYPVPDDPALNKGILIVEAPVDSGFYNRLNTPEFGDGRAGDIVSLNTQDAPAVDQTWQAILVGQDKLGYAKWPDADDLDGVVGIPDFGDSPRYTFTVAALPPVGPGGTEYTANVGGVGGTLRFGISADGTEIFWIGVTLWDLPADDRYAGSIPTVRYDYSGGFIPLGYTSPTDTFNEYGPFPMLSGSHTVEIFAPGYDQDNDANSIVLGTTPGIVIEEPLEAQTDGVVDARRVSPSTWGKGIKRDSINKKPNLQTDDVSLGFDSSGNVTVIGVDLRRVLTAYLSTDFSSSSSAGLGIAAVDLTKAKPGSYSADFGINSSSGDFQQNQVDLSKTLLSTLQLGILGVASGKLAVTGVDFSKALGGSYNSTDFTLSGGVFVVNGVDLRKAISSSVSSEFSTSVSAGLGVNSFSAAKITAFTSSSNFQFTGTLAAGVAYVGAIIASATTSGTFNGVSLILSLNGVTISINAGSDGTGSYGITIMDNTSGSKTYLSPFRLRSTGVSSTGAWSTNLEMGGAGGGGTNQLDMVKTLAGGVIYETRVRPGQITLSQGSSVTNYP